MVFSDVDDTIKIQQGPFPRDPTQANSWFFVKFFTCLTKYGPVPRSWLHYSKILGAACWCFVMCDWQSFSNKFKTHSLTFNTSFRGHSENIGRRTEEHSAAKKTFGREPLLKSLRIIVVTETLSKTQFFKKSGFIQNPYLNEYHCLLLNLPHTVAQLTP